MPSTSLTSHPLTSSTSHVFDFTKIAPQDHTDRTDHTEIALITLRRHRSHWDRTTLSHRNGIDRTDCTENAPKDRIEIAPISLFPDLVSPSFVDRICWIFFFIGFCFCVYLLRNGIIYLFGSWENVRNKKKICFLYYFQQHNQTLKNIFQNIFWNATKYLKIFSFPENSISEKYLFFGKYLFFEKYFTWTKHSLRLSNYETNRTLTQLKP